MSQTLYAKNNSQYDEVDAARWQATQVSTISVMNFLGRILIGEGFARPLADHRLLSQFSSLLHLLRSPLLYSCLTMFLLRPWR